MSTTLKDKIVTIRKPRQCFSCYRKFEIGTKMRYWAGVFEGDFNSTYNCLICNEIIDKEPHWEDGIPEGYVHEMLIKDQTPEDLLATLNKTQCV